MSIENITSKIELDSKKASGEILATAKRESDELLAQAKAKADSILEDAVSRGLSEKDKLVETKKKVAIIDSKKILLEKKQSKIDECFNNVINEILNFKKDSYILFLSNILKETGYTNGVLIFNEKEKKELANELLDSVRKVIPDSNFEVSSDTRDVRGGFYLQHGAVYVNLTVEGIINGKKQEMLSEVANRLFR